MSPKKKTDTHQIFAENRGNDIRWEVGDRGDGRYGGGCVRNKGTIGCGDVGKRFDHKEVRRMIVEGKARNVRKEGGGGGEGGMNYLLPFYVAKGNHEVSAGTSKGNGKGYERGNNPPLVTFPGDQRSRQRED